MSSEHSLASAPERPAPPEPARSATGVFRVATAVIWTLLILVLCWLPKEYVHKVEDEASWFRIPNLDKVVHCGLFVVLSILWLRLRRAPGSSPPGVGRLPSAFSWIGMVVLGGFALGAVSELGQLVPIVGRDADLYDLVTDCVGVLIGLAIAPLVEPLIRFGERRLFREPATRPVPEEPTARIR